LEKINFKGVTEIANGSYKTDFKIAETNQVGHVYIQPDGLHTYISGRDGDVSTHQSTNLAFSTVTLTNGATSGELNASDLESTGPIVFQTTGGGRTWRAAFFKKFHYVWMSGVVDLNAGVNYNIGNLGDGSIFPRDHRFIAIHPLSSTNQYGMLQISPGGDLHIVNAPITDRYTIEGLFYRIENL